MDTKTFSYLYYKTRGYSDEEICRESELTEEEFQLFEQAMQALVEEIRLKKTRAERIGNDFVHLTRYIYDGKSDQECGLTRPDAIKARSGEIFPLPAVGTLDFKQLSLQEAIEQRRSLRKYSDTEMSSEELSFLLWAASWARDFRSNERMEITLRNVPSAGARHPLETFVDLRRVKGFKPGLYYYHPIKHCLVLISDKPETHEAIFEGCFRQDMVQNSAVNFIYTAVPYRTVWRYGQRGFRYLYLDAGHAGQNVHLAAEAIGAGACMIGAYMDEAMNDALGIDGIEEFVIYVAAVGKK
jgi:SagB-type dehydrogenase family enzyme